MSNNSKNTVNNKKKNKNSAFSAFSSTASVIGMHMISGPLLGCILGYLFDNYFKTDPIGLIVGFIVGIAAGYRNVMEDAQKLLKERERLAQEVSETIESDIKDDEYVEYELFGKHKKVKFDEEGNKTVSTQENEKTTSSNTTQDKLNNE